jgi:Fe-S oxidoreductase
MLARLKRLPGAPVDHAIYADESQRRKLWQVREGALGAESFVPGQPETWPGWEDSAVRPERVGAYLRDLRALFDRYDYHPALYGHFGMGCVHCTVCFDLRSAGGVAKYRAFAREAADLVARYGGSLSGEHGDGQSRGELLPVMFGPEVMRAFREFKAIWDPDGKMNPGKLIDARPLDADLRLGSDYHPWEPATHFRYPEDHGSFAHATLRCIGIGQCRRTGADGEPEDDVMCPSYMVTHEERHTTRGRAHLLHEMLVKGPIRGGFRDPEVKEALDLCLSCKGCKGDCPVNVDVATHKAEFLSHYYERRLRPRSAYAFGWIDKWARIASLAPGLVNLVTQTPGLSAFAKIAAGMPLTRRIPAFAPQTFRSWFAARPPRQSGPATVVLWPDTFSNYFHPEVAKAALRALEHAGYRVVLPDEPLCCGRPLYDYGFLPAAKRYLNRVLRAMAPHIAAGTPVVVLEPSCASVFRDELHGLYPDRAEADRFRKQVKLLGEFLVLGQSDYVPPLLARKAIGQGHCHHKSVLGYEDETALLAKMRVDFELLPSGCCGMAGAFGFERGEKYRVSLAAAERVLLPAVRAASPSTLIIADGFSCRTQIEQRTHRRALHVAQVLAMAIEDGPGGRPGPEPPEHRSCSERAAAVRASVVRAGAALLVAGVALAATRWLLRR